MTRQHPTPRRFIRRMRPDPERFAAAAAVQDPGLMLQLRAANEDAEEPSDPPPLRSRGVLASSCPAR